MCYSVYDQKCLMSNSVTNNSDLKGCFWNPQYEQFSCVVSGNASFFMTSECQRSCPKVCSENYWKCNDLCIPISQQCYGRCMPVYTYECNGTCIPINKPCNGICFDVSQISCNGQCLDPKIAENLMTKNGCTGE
jgi:hypothetical protein